MKNELIKTIYDYYSLHPFQGMADELQDLDALSVNDLLQIILLFD